MFDLEQAIQSWKQLLKKSPAFEEGHIKEMETHLRDDIDRLMEPGLTQEQAFTKAVEKMGPVQDLGDEVYKTKTANRIDATPPWKYSSWIPSMLPNYVKVTLRNFRKNLAFSTINALGLSVSLAVALLVITFIKDQADYDSFHSNADRIYRVTTSINAETSTQRYASTAFALASIIKNEIPEVEEATHIQPFFGAVSIGNNRFTLNGFRVDSVFLKLFDFELVAGNAEQALATPQSVVLSKETAERFFGNENPMGKTLLLNNGQTHEVTGVLAGEKHRSHLEFEALIPVQTNAAAFSMNTGLQSWDNPAWYTYFLMDKQADPEEFTSKLSQVVRSHYSGNDISAYELSLQPLNRINLGERMARQIGRITPIEFVYFLAALALVIILAACVNYVNLTVARSLKRAKEIGLRKVIGANRIQLIGQFLMESIVLALISLGVGLLLFWAWMLPFWNSLRLATADFGEIAFNTSRDIELYLIFFGFTVLIGVLAGIYPALKLSSFTPAETLKDKFTKGNASGWSLRKMLVVFQISLSLILVVSSFLLYRQSNLLLNADYGFKKANVINVKIGEVSYDSFRQEAVNQAGVADVSATSKLPGVDFPTKQWASREDRSDSLSAAVYSVDEHFKDSFGLTLVAGRNFSKEYSTDTQGAIIINETAIQKFGFESPAQALGNSITIKDAIDGKFQIIGVVKDFQFDFLWNPISPLVLRNNPSGFEVINIHLDASDHKATIDNLASVWQNFEPIAPLNYQYYVDEIDNVYTDFQELVFIIAFLALLAILIACFGLLAMAHYDTQSRIKEVGVRKVFGASVQQVIILLSTDFTKMIGIALVIGIPATIYLNNLWLQVFANKVAFGVWVIISGVVLTILLTLSSIGWQTYKAAQANPVKSLRSE